MSDYSINASIGADDSDFAKVIENVITGLGDISKSFETMSDDTKSSFADIANQFNAIDGKAKLWGETTDTIADKQKVLKDAINNLIDQGIAPESQQIQDLKSAYDKLGETQDDTGKKSDTLKDKFADIRDIMQGPVAAAKMLVDGLKAMVEAIGDLSKEFAEDETAQVKFEAAIKSSAKMTKGAADRLNELATALATSTGEANSAAQSQVAMLVATGRSEAEIKKMITAAKGLSVATGVDLDTALTQINATFSGTIGRLGKTTPALNELKEEEIKNGAAVDILIEKYGDMADALDKTSDVSLKNNINQWGEVKSAIGLVLEESVKPMRDQMTKMFKDFVEWAGTNDNLKKTLEAIGLVVLSVGSAIATFAVVVNISAILSGVTTAVGALAAGFRLLTVAIASNPIGAIAAAITLVLVPAIILLIKNWDEVTQFFTTTWATIKALFEISCANIKLFFVTAFNGIKIAMLEFAQTYITTVLGSIENLLTTASKIPVVGEKFKEASKGVEGFKTNIEQSIKAAQDDATQSITTATTARDQAVSRGKAELKRIEDEKKAREKLAKDEKNLTEDTQDDETKSDEIIIKSNEDKNIAIGLSSNKLFDLQVGNIFKTVDKNKFAVTTLTTDSSFYYEEQIRNENKLKKEREENAKAWINNSKEILNSVGGEGASVLSDVIKTTGEIVKAVTSNFTDVQADINAIVGLIGLAGKANKDKFKELQDMLNDIGIKLLEAIEPALSLILDIVIDLLPIIKEFIPIIKLIFDAVEPLLPIIRAFALVAFGPLLLELKAINFVLENMQNLIAPVKEEFRKFGEWAKTNGADFVNNMGLGIKGAMEGLWNTIKPGFDGIANAIGGIFSTAAQSMKIPLNGIVGLVNYVIKALNTLAIHIPDTQIGPIKIPGFDWGINIPEVGYLAKGTDNWRGGMAIVGEQGPELLNLPKGSSVTPTDKTQDILAGNKTTNATYNFYSPVALNQQEIIAQMKQADREMAFQGVAG